MESPSTISHLPAELLQHILQFLPTPEMVRSRRVCRHWCAAVDALTGREYYWRRKCARDHAATHERARTKFHPDLTWRQLYQSLHLWTKLDTVPETNWTKLYTGQSRGDFVFKVSAFHGNALIHMEDDVLYCDMKGNQTDIFNTVGINMGYEDIENIIVYSLRMTLHPSLCIIKKVDGRLDFENKVLIHNALDFAIVGEDVYYLKYEKDQYGDTLVHVYVSRAEDDYKTSIKLESFDERIISFGHCNNAMCLLMETEAILVLEDNDFVCKGFLDDDKNIVMLKKYNFKSCWKLLDNLTTELGFYVASYLFYGDLLFVGDNKGVVKVYNSDKLISNPRCKPLVKYNLAAKLKLNNKNCGNPISGIDIIEKESGHYILVSVYEGAYAIELNQYSKGQSDDDDFIYTRTRSRKRKMYENAKVLRSKIKGKERGNKLRKQK